MEILQDLIDNKISQAIQDGRVNDLKFWFTKWHIRNNPSLNVSLLMCPHKPDHFPICDDRKAIISGWQMERGYSYETLKHKIDIFQTKNRLDSLDYFYFNKLLWYCE